MTQKSPAKKNALSYKRNLRSAVICLSVPGFLSVTCKQLSPVHFMSFLQCTSAQLEDKTAFLILSLHSKFTLVPVFTLQFLLDLFLSSLHIKKQCELGKKKNSIMLNFILDRIFILRFCIFYYVSSFTSQNNASTLTHSHICSPNFPTCLYFQFQFVALHLFLSSAHSLFTFKIQANKIPSNIFLNQRGNGSEEKQNN